MRPPLSHHHGHEHEHEFEPQLGLPEKLPATEKILWQGAPNWLAMARYTFHVRKLSFYFAAIILIRVFVVMTEPGLVNPGMTALISALWLGLLAFVAILILTFVAYLSAKTTVYTITNRRIVMRVGIVLTVTFNLPFKRIAAANLRALSGGRGDICVSLMESDKIAYAHLWPHARPWRFAKPEPMLRCLTNAQTVAALLTEAWSAVVSGGSVNPQPTQAVRPLEAHCQQKSVPAESVEQGYPRGMQAS
ncbi:MAG: hypothetical protein RL132_291 [Pseudomonadota bacterium]|jgi:hypothetical protein